MTPLAFMHLWWRFPAWRRYTGDRDLHWHIDCLNPGEAMAVRHDNGQLCVYRRKPAKPCVIEGGEFITTAKQGEAG